jgi:hypothetical protein
MSFSLRKTKWWGTTTSLLALLLAVAAMFFVWDTRHGLKMFIESHEQPARAIAPSVPPSNTASPEEQLKALQARVGETEKQLDVDEKRLDALRARAADIQLFVTILLGLGTLYAAAQALFSYFNVQALVKAARDEAEKQAEKQAKEWSEFQDLVHKQFPRFVGMDEVRTSILGQLNAILRTKDADENLFNRLEVEKRQRVYFYEKSIAGLEFLNLNQTEEDSVKVFRGLGRFYIDKYIHLQKFEGRISKDDLDRGEFYLQLALARKNDDYRVLNDQGKVQADIYSNNTAAKALWKQSLAKDSGQQRAFYDLGTLSFQTGDYDKAVDFLREGTKRNRWEEERNAANEGNLYFNLACALSNQAVKNGAAQPETEAIEALKKAVAIHPKLRGDIPGEKDLEHLAAAVGGEQELLKRL